MALLQLARYSHLVDRIGKATRWSPERIQRVQNKRLKRLLRWSVKRSPFYREKYRGIDIATAPLCVLPSVTKDEVRDHFDCVVTDTNIRRDDVMRFMEDEKHLGKWFMDRYGVSHTSGSQGAPLVIVQDRQCLETMFAISSSRASVVRQPGIVEAARRLISPKKIAVVTFRQGFFPSYAAFEFMESIVGRYANVARFSSTQPDLIERLREFQPEVLVSYASILDSLASHASDLALRGLKQISNSSEQLRPTAREHIERAFGVPILDHYGAGECLFLAEGCTQGGGMHINSDWTIVEVVDKRNRPVPDGEIGDKILVTNLANYVQPFIRYEIGDRVRMATEPCACGSSYPKIDQIEGRSADLLWVRHHDQHVPVPGVMLHVAMDESNSVRQWQAVQVGPQQIVLKLVPLQALPGNNVMAHDTLKHHLSQKLVELGLPQSTHLDIQFVDQLSPDPQTGKLRQIISKVPSLQRAG